MRRPALLLAALACLGPASAGAQAAAGDSDPVALAIAARDQGEAAGALALWEKAAAISPSDGFLHSQKGWSLLALGRAREAKKAFARAAELAADAAGLAEAHFGTGLSQFFESELKLAAKTLEAVCQESPSLYPASSAWLAKVALRMRKPDVASLYLKHSLEQDPMHPGALDALGGLYERHGMSREAWQCYREALSLNPFDARALEGTRKAEQSMKTPGVSFGARRLKAPLLQKPPPPPPSPRLRVGLFAGADGTSVPLRRIRFASGVSLKLSKAGKELGSSAANQNWEASWDAENRVLELRDPGRKLKYAGRDAVRVEPAEPGGSVLLRDAQADGAPRLDLGDRELRGALELKPAAAGFLLVNELGVEEYLFSQVAALSPNGAPAEELKAQAVALRSSLDELKRRFAQPALGADLCDSSRCQVYLGLSQERSDATAAVEATAGQRLYPARGAVSVHAHCAGLTEEGIFDVATSSGIPSARSTETLERFLHGDPAKDQFCNMSRLAPANWARWIRVLEPRQIEEAASDRAKLGRLRSVRVLSRSPAGRISALELEGSEGRATFREGDELARLLPRLGLRSSLFSVQPLFQGKELEHLVVWGAGAGDGHGMCVAGALGLASDGRDYRSILLHYFPGAEIR